MSQQCNRCENTALESLAICEECLVDLAAQTASNMGSPFDTEEDLCRFRALNPHLEEYLEDFYRKREV